MRINKIDIKAFGKLKDLNLNFKDGFNVVYGENEAGKSTLQWFLRAMFYGLKGGKAGSDGFLAPVKRFKPWLSDDYKGTIEYSLENKKNFRVERDFKNDKVNVFDSNFNDIAKDFELVKNKGVMFAENQFGVSETLFEKTVFVKQTETRFDSKGSSELLTRLTNVSQTGFVDISFNNAKEALKEAIKSNVGTDRTSTMPLDKVIVRLEELEKDKSELVLRRDSFFETEENLGKAMSENKQLTAKMELAKQAHETCIYIEEVEQMLGQKANITKSIEALKAKENEEKQVGEKLEELSRTAIKLEPFSTFSDDDIDKMTLGFAERNRLMQENQNLVTEAEIEQKEKQKVEAKLETRKIFDDSEGNIVEKVKTIMGEIDELKKCSISSDPALMKSDKEAYSTMGKAMIFSSIFVIIAAISLFIISLAGGIESTFGLINMAVSILIFMVGLSLLITAFVRGAKKSSANRDVKSAKDDAEISKIIKDKEAERDAIFETVNAKNYEDFIGLKADYNNKIENRDRITKKLEEIKSRININSEDIEKLDSAIYERLINSKIIKDRSEAINEELIRNFREGVRQFRDLEPKVIYNKKRIEDLQSEIKNIYAGVIKKYGNKSEKIEDLEQLIDQTEDQLKTNREIVENKIANLDERQNSLGLQIYNFNNYTYNRSDQKTDELEAAIKSDHDTLFNNIQSNKLKIKELETILKTTGDDEGALQKIEEEIAELLSERERLTDTGKCLQTALDIMDESSMEIQQSFAPILNEKMSKTISKITANRYNELKADNDLTLRVINPETGDIGLWSQLSGGAIDQIYFALRIAMADMIQKPDETLPLIMDEVMAQYDDIRTENTIDFLTQMADDRQIILLTCKKREVEIARKVCGDKVNIINL